jgi:hypothetical protein
MRTSKHKKYEKCREAFAKFERELNATAIDVDSDDTSPMSESEIGPTLSVQTTLEEFNSRSSVTTKPLPYNTSQKETLDNYYIDFLISSESALNLGTNRSFRKFPRFLMSKKAGYKLPSRRNITREIFRREVDLDSWIKEEMDSALYVCLATDGWTSRSGVSMFGIAARYVTKTFHIRNCVLVFEWFGQKHTSESISSWLLTKMKENNIVPKVVMASSDNATNMVKAFQGVLEGWGEEQIHMHQVQDVPEEDHDDKGEEEDGAGKSKFPNS